LTVDLNKEPKPTELVWLYIPSLNQITMASPQVWQHAASFADTNAFMLDNQVLSDVTIVAGTDKQEIPCHRFILASRSPVFYTTFCGSLPETGRVEIPDIEAETLRNVIR